LYEAPISTTSTDKAAFYDEVYQKENYFGCRQWLYRPYVKALVSLAGLREGSTILDAGCGQGFFANLFAEEGMSVFGVDISQVAIQKAKEKYPELSDRFFVLDFENPSNAPKVDCVFIRNCSLYNTRSFRDATSPTRGLLELLRPGGAFIFALNTNLSQTGKSFLNHNLADVRSHFHLRATNYELYYINKIDPLVLGRQSFNKEITGINELASKITSLSGDAIVIARKEN
jgi:SAM-dependent methyltransferase